MPKTLEPLQIPNDSVNHELAHCVGPRIERFVELTFPQLFEEMAVTHADRVAVTAGTERLTYAELNARANQLARHLRAQGAQPETLIGICIDRSLDMAVGILGILKSGAGYLPIDPDYPVQRLNWMLNDSGVTVVVTNRTLGEKLSSSSAQLIALDVERPTISAQSTTNLEHGPAPADLAYVIYTSGSTGEPKGVMITHASLANYVLALHHELGINSGDRYLHTASIAFSSSRRQLLLPLSQGAAVMIASSDQRKDPLALFQMIKSEGVTVMDAVPSFWRTCTELLRTLDERRRRELLNNQLRLMLSASEPLLSHIPQTWQRDFHHPARHVHMFGQTETAGIVCLHEVVLDNEETRDAVKVVPVGLPIANTEIYILDDKRQPVSPGTAGELYIGGAGVGRGYLHRPELTAARFIPHPFKDDPAARLYRSGDWARLRLDGAIECVGRHDSQVKIRGFRVELGEVQTILAAHPSVANNVVVAKEGAGSDKRLVSYFVKRAGSSTANDLRNYLSERLPDYMVPSAFVELPELPLNANGKVNRLALPEPPAVRPDLLTPYQVPQTATEELLASIWSNVLGIENPGIDDDFFHLGGHSLLAMQVISRVNERLKVSLAIREMFDGPTIRELAAKIATQPANTPSKSIAPIERSQEIPLSFAQQRFWFLDQLEPGSPLYNVSRALRLNGPLDINRLQKAAQQIVARHDALRTRFVEVDGRPVQVVVPELDLPLQFHDLRSVSSIGRDTEALIARETETPFNLASGPLLRVTILRIADEDHVLLLSIHHVIADAWSLNLFFQELAAFYQNDLAVVKSLRVQYPDYASWQQQHFDGEELRQQLSYWKNELAGAPLVLDLPTDHQRNPTAGSRGAKQSMSLPDGLGRLLKDTSCQEGVTLFMFLLAGFQILLSRYSGQDDFLVGTPVAGRAMLETEGLIGCFINTLVIRGNLAGNPTLTEVIKRTREKALRAYAQQDIPFEKLVEELRPERSLSRSPIFQVMFVLQDETKAELSLPGLVVTPVVAETATAKFELTLGVTDKAGGLDVWLSYNTDLFEPDSITAMLHDFKLVLENLVDNREQHLSDLPSLNWQPKAMREPGQISTRDEAHSPKEFMAPRTPVEERLASIWSEVLRVDQVSINDNFFELGGHSLLAAQVIARTRTRLSAELTLRRLFETPTIAGLAEAIYELQTAETEDEELAAMLAELNQLSDEEAQQRVASAL